MKKLLFDYMNKRQAKPKTSTPEELNKFVPGPVITISRDYGCHGSSIGLMLVNTINHKNKSRRKNTNDWQFISKEILEQSAKELNMKRDTLDVVSFAQNDDVFSNITSLFSGSFTMHRQELRLCGALHLMNFALW